MKLKCRGQGTWGQEASRRGCEQSAVKLKCWGQGTWEQEAGKEASRGKEVGTGESRESVSVES